MALLARNFIRTAARSGVAGRPGIGALAVRPFSEKAAEPEKAAPAAPESASANYGARFGTSIEIAFSKLFPGGFGWVYAGNMAEAAGMGADTAGFALATGLGDAIGVGGGHIVWFTAKKLIQPEINIFEQISLGTWLGSAAMISGTIWQPIVNALGVLGYGFPATFAVTGALCGFGFYTGLRFFRQLYHPFFALPAPNGQNLVADAQLAISVGGAAGTFTATDPALLGNFYAGFLGIQPTDAPLLGCARAGTSTWLGFLKVQSVQNIFYPANRNWIDGGNMKTPGC